MEAEIDRQLRDRSGVTRPAPGIGWRVMAEDRRIELDDLLVRPGTYLNPQTEVMVVVDDSPSIDSEIFNLEEFEGADWVLVSDEVPIDESRRDELLETFQATYHGERRPGVSARRADDDPGEVEPDPEEAGSPPRSSARRSRRLPRRAARLLPGDLHSGRDRAGARARRAGAGLRGGRPGGDPLRRGDGRGHRGDRRAHRPGIGGLLNVTFGNAPELIIAFFALIEGLQEVVKASIVGSVIGNILLVMGAAMFVGGMPRDKQTFSRTAANAQSAMLMLALAALVFPAIFQLVHGGGLPRSARSGWTSAPTSRSSRSAWPSCC